METIFSGEKKKMYTKALLTSQGRVRSDGDSQFGCLCAENLLEKKKVAQVCFFMFMRCLTILKVQNIFISISYT